MGFSRGGDRLIALAVAAALLLVYNANGREIGSYDSQPTKFAARELLLRGTLTLNHVVGARPAYADRAAFVLCLDGHYRSAYSPVPALAAAAIAYPLVRAHLLDPGSPRAPGAIAKVIASVLTAVSVGLLYLAARRRTTRFRSLMLAAGLGMGTGFWYLVSQTLWAHETAILGLAIAVTAFTATDDRLSSRHAIWTAAGLALAGVARPQVSPMIAILLAGLWTRAPRRTALVAAGIVGAAALWLMAVYWSWFGSPFGAQTLLQAKDASVHVTQGWTDSSFAGVAGLLVSPSRGLLVFSPVVAVALIGFADAARASWRSPLRWCALAAAAQMLLYGWYAVWWGGHTYGPRYLLDVLPMLVPLAAAVLGRIELRPATAALCGAALVWSIAISATGAFCYPNDRWNSTPIDVDREHTRLWEWSDPQFVRCWREGPSPQNFELFGVSD